SSAQTLACLIRLFMFSVSESMKTWHQGRGLFFRAWHCPCRNRGTILRHRCPEIAVCTNKETKRMTAKPAIAYIRVSRPRQGRSGLGLEAQQAAIVVFAKAHAYRISETFSEVETGKGADALSRRPKLAAAIKAARKLGKSAPVIVAKLDRLSRDVH